MRLKFGSFICGLPIGCLAVLALGGNVGAQDCLQSTNTTGDCCGTSVFPPAYLASGGECNRVNYTYIPCGCREEFCCPDENLVETCACTSCLMSCS
jgi:hypothetical protein